MWSNLRDVAGKISSVVAPPPTDEEDYDEEEEEGDEEYEEEYYEEESEHGNDNSIPHEGNSSNENIKSSPFGFVGLLTRAMDQSELLHQQSEESNYGTDCNQKPQTYMSAMSDVLSEEDGGGINKNNLNEKVFIRKSMNEPIEIQSDDDDDEIDFGYNRTQQPPAPSTNSNHMNDLTPSPLQAPSLFVEESSSTAAAADSAHHHVPIVPSQPPEPPTNPSTDEEPPMSPYQRRKHLPRDDSMDYEYQPPDFSSMMMMRNYTQTHPTSTSVPVQASSTTNTSTTSIELSPSTTNEPPALLHVDTINQHSPEEPIRFSLVRESGSVSPQRTSTKKMISTMGTNSRGDPPVPFSNDTPASLSSNQYTTNNISSRSLGSTPCGKEVLLSPLRDILQLEQEEQQDAVTNTSDSSVLAQLHSRRNMDDENIDNDTAKINTDPTGSIAHKQFPRDALLGSFSVPNDSDDIAPLIPDDDDDDNEEEQAAEVNDKQPSFSSSSNHFNNVQSVPSTNEMKTKVLHRADSGQLPASKHRGSQTRMGKSSLPMISLESFDENDDVDHSNGDSSVSANRNHQETTITEQPISSSSSEMKGLEDMQHNEQLEAMHLLDIKCNELQTKLMNAESVIAELQKKKEPPKHQDKQPTNVDYETLMIQFQEKEARLLQAANEEHQNEIKNVRFEMNQQILTLQQQLLDERNAFRTERDQFESKLEEYQGTVVKIQSQSRIDQETTERAMDQMQQQHARVLRKVEDKLATALSSLEERDNDTKRYKEQIKQLESKLSEQDKGVNEVEEEVNELHNENEILHDHIERLQAEAVELRNTITKLEGDSEKLVHLKMELRMLKEDHSREKAKIQTVAASAESSTVQLEAERDEALAKVHDLQIQLSAAMADLHVAKSDAERIMQANTNLQSALEAFQSERDAEMAMMEENQRERERALAAKHVAILDATHEANQAEIRQIQQVSDAALLNSMEEIKKLEDKLEKYRVENVQTRRSLDEAIKRLQATQDDVIDRTFMKNILLDWLTKNDRKEKVQVLEIMASLLHFTDAEKEKVHIDDGGGSLRKLVIPPPPKVDLESLEGDNVREKWVNFLIAEADD